MFIKTTSISAIFSICYIYVLSSHWQLSMTGIKSVADYDTERCERCHKLSCKLIRQYTGFPGLSCRFVPQRQHVGWLLVPDRTEVFPRSVLHIRFCSTYTDQTFPSKVRHMGSASVQSVSNVWIIIIHVPVPHVCMHVRIHSKKQTKQVVHSVTGKLKCLTCICVAEAVMSPVMKLARPLPVLLGCPHLSPG